MNELKKGEEPENIQVSARRDIRQGEGEEKDDDTNWQMNCANELA